MRATFVYDSDCGICTATVAWLRARGADDAMRFLPCDEAVADLAAHAISPAACLEAAYLLEPGRPPRRAAAAINGALALLPGPRRAGWRGLARLYRVPGIRHAEDLGYAVIARNRHRLGARACEVRGGPP